MQKYYNKLMHENKSVLLIKASFSSDTSQRPIQTTNYKKTDMAWKLYITQQVSGSAAVMYNGDTYFYETMIFSTNLHRENKLTTYATSRQQPIHCLMLRWMTIYDRG